MKKLKQRVFEIISKADEGDRMSRLFDGMIMTLILLSVVSIILESYKTLAENYKAVFRAFEYVTVVVFTLEYILRIWTADLLYPGSRHPHFKYIFSFMAIIDVMAILPFFIPFISLDG